MAFKNASDSKHFSSRSGLLFLPTMSPMSSTSSTMSSQFPECPSSPMCPMCPLCQENMMGEVVHMSNCRHMFCISCTTSFYRRVQTVEELVTGKRPDTSKCPVCRQPSAVVFSSGSFLKHGSPAKARAVEERHRTLRYMSGRIIGSNMWKNLFADGTFYQSFLICIQNIQILEERFVILKDLLEEICNMCSKDIQNLNQQHYQESTQSCCIELNDLTQTHYQNVDCVNNVVLILEGYRKLEHVPYNVTVIKTQIEQIVRNQTKYSEQLFNFIQLQADLSMRQIILKEILVSIRSSIRPITEPTTQEFL